MFLLYKLLILFGFFVEKLLHLVSPHLLFSTISICPRTFACPGLEPTLHPTPFLDLLWLVCQFQATHPLSYNLPPSSLSLIYSPTFKTPKSPIVISLDPLKISIFSNPDLTSPFICCI